MNFLYWDQHSREPSNLILILNFRIKHTDVIHRIGRQVTKLKAPVF